MGESFRLLPEEASHGAWSVDAVTLGMLGVTVFFTLLIATLIVWFLIRYRFTATVNRRVTKSTLVHAAVEVGWTTGVLVILLVAFAFGAAVYVEEHEPPADPVEISVVGKQWMWKVSHESGRREINSLHVPAGRPVRLRMTSEDVIHSFFVPVFRVKQDVLPGRYTAMWFEPNKPGRYHLFCAEYCGTDHSRMRGEVVVQSPEEYAAWAAEGAKPPDQAGRRVIETFGCTQCHGDAATGAGPPLEGLLGRKVRLADGRTVVADAEYVRRSITDPQTEVVAGYKPVMPTYAGRIEPEQIDAIVAWLRASKTRAEKDGPGGGNEGRSEGGSGAGDPNRAEGQEGETR